jgi:hypothetical protein
MSQRTGSVMADQSAEWHTWIMSAAYEELLAFIAAQLNDPVEQQEDAEGAIVFTSGDPGEVIVKLTGSQVAVAAFAVSWHTPYDPVVEPIGIGVVNWCHISPEATMRAVKALIVAAREARRAKFSTCHMCERLLPPEWMHTEDVCQGCAKGELGVVH